MKICIVSDSHDKRTLLENAVAQAKALGAEAVLHCGDVVAPSTLKVLQPLGLPVHVIHGNNTGDLYMLSRVAARENSVITYHGQDAGIKLADRKIFLVHYPHYAKALATTGDWDIVCCGHNHKAAIDKVANMNQQETILLNPGSTGGVEVDPTYILGDLETLEFEIKRVE